MDDMYRIHTSIGNRNDFLYARATCTFHAAKIFLLQLGYNGDPIFRYLSGENASVFEFGDFNLFVKEIKNF